MENNTNSQITSKKKCAWKNDKMRVLFSQILCSCFYPDKPQKSPAGNFDPLLTPAWNSQNTLSQNEYRPFTNKFHINKLNETIFTYDIIREFLGMCKSYYANKEPKNILSHAIEVIKNSDFSSDLITPNQHLDNTLFFNCEKINHKEGCTFECLHCPAKWLYENLSYLEELQRPKELPREYVSEKTSKKVTAMFDSIKNSEKIEILTLEQTERLFNRCKSCFQINAVRDYKLAYTKWFTAHIMVHPLFYDNYKILDNTNETAIYKLLTDASRIMKELSHYKKKKFDYELLIRIECERIIAYLTAKHNHYLPYVKLYDDEKYLISLSKRKSLAAEQKFELYIHLWLLSIESNFTTNKVYESEIENLITELSSTENSKVIYLKCLYYVYKFLYIAYEKKETKFYTVHCFYKAKESLTQINTTESLRNEFQDSIFILTRIFTNSLNKKIQSKVLNNIYGGTSKTPASIKPMPPQPPTQYHRIFTKELDLKKSGILMHYHRLCHTWYAENQINRYLKKENCVIYDSYNYRIPVSINQILNNLTLSWNLYKYFPYIAVNFEKNEYKLISLNCDKLIENPEDIPMQKLLFQFLHLRDNYYILARNYDTKFYLNEKSGKEISATGVYGLMEKNVFSTIYVTSQNIYNATILPICISQKQSDMLNKCAPDGLKIHNNHVHYSESFLLDKYIKTNNIKRLLELGYQFSNDSSSLLSENDLYKMIHCYYQGKPIEFNVIYPSGKQLKKIYSLTDNHYSEKENLKKELKIWIERNYLIYNIENKLVSIEEILNLADDYTQYFYALNYYTKDARAFYITNYLVFDEIDAINSTILIYGLLQKPIRYNFFDTASKYNFQIRINGITGSVDEMFDTLINQSGNCDICINVENIVSFRLPLIIKNPYSDPKNIDWLLMYFPNIHQLNRMGYSFSLDGNTDLDYIEKAFLASSDNPLNLDVILPDGQKYPIIPSKDLYPSFY